MQAAINLSLAVPSSLSNPASPAAKNFSTLESQRLFHPLKGKGRKAYTHSLGTVKSLGSVICLGGLGVWGLNCLGEAGVGRGACCFLGGVDGGVGWDCCLGGVTGTTTGLAAKKGISTFFCFATFGGLGLLLPESSSHAKKSSSLFLTVDGLIGWIFCFFEPPVAEEVEED